MIDIAWIKNILTTSTSYPIEASRDLEINIENITDLPIIYIGYSAIDSAQPNLPIAMDLYNSYGENLVQSFDIKIVCVIEDLVPIWRNIYKVLIGKHPTETYGGTASTSGLTYVQGGVVGLSNGRIWHLDRWRVGFPTDTPLF